MRAILVSALLSTAALANSEDRSVPAFTGVHIASGMRATIEIGPQKVHIDADAETLALIESRVEDGVLKIGFKPHNWYGDHRVKITIQTPKLESVGASGGSNVRAAFTKASDSSIEASGGSEITATGIDAGKLSAETSGGSILQISGSSDSVELQRSARSQLHGHDFSTRDARVHGSGGAQAELKASGSIKGSLSGGSELHVAGAASTRVSTSGGSQ